MKLTKWGIGYKCSKCLEEITYNERMSSNGICIKCGHKDCTSATITNTIEFSYRYKIYWDFKYPFRHKIREVKAINGI